VLVSELMEKNPSQQEILEDLARWPQHLGLSTDPGNHESIT